MRRDKGLKKAGGAVDGKKLEVGEDGDGGGFFSTLLGSILGTGGGVGIGAAIKTYFTSGKGTGLWGKILPKVLTVGRFIPIIGAIIGPLIDGISGWFKADEWGTSKAGAVIGAAIGGTGSGASGAAWGALKGGTVGFAVGGPLGALAGVLIGAVAGWFGGERIAKALDKIGDFFSREWTKVMDFFGFASEEDSKKLAIERQKKTIELEKSRKEKGPQKDMFGNVLAYTVHDPEKLREAEEKLANLEAGKGEISNERVENEIANLEDMLATNKNALKTANVIQAGNIKRVIRNTEEKLLKLRGSLARGGIVTKPLYLPSSGVVVGEHPSYSGRGAYAGGLTRGIPDRQNATGMEGIVPFDQRGIDIMKDAVGLPVASAVGAQLNASAFDKIGLGGPAGMGSPPAIIDNTTVNNVSNNTIVRSPSPRGQEMHFERSDFVHKIA